MINASITASIFKEAVIRGYNLVTGDKNRVERLNEFVYKYVKQQFSKYDVKMSNLKLKINVVDNEIYFKHELPTIAQLTYENVDGRVLTMVYNCLQDKLVYTFGEQVYSIKDGNINIIEKYSPVGLSAISDIVNTSLVTYASYDCTDTLVCMNSMGAAILDIICGTLDNAYCHGFDEENYAELLTICKVCDIKIVYVNNMSKFSRG